MAGMQVVVNCYIKFQCTRTYNSSDVYINSESELDTIHKKPLRWVVFAISGGAFRYLIT